MDAPNPLLAYGYTPSQAAWLRLVMLHAGVFLRRQYVAFLRARTSGSPDVHLLRRLLTQGHARRLPYHGRERLYHVHARPLYAAIGHEDLRHRRLMTPWLSAIHLLLLDFIVAEPDDYLESEDAKVRRFLELGAARDTLPHRVYRSRYAPTNTTTRYFVEPYGIAVHEHRVRVVIPDLAPRSAAPMREFLHRYRRLLDQLPHVEIVYVTPRGESGDTAQRLYRGLPVGRSADQAAPTIEELDEFFRVRAALDERAYGRLTRGALDRHGVWAARLSGREYDHLYEVWRHGGVVALTRARQRAVPENAPLSFRHVALPCRYYCLATSARGATRRQIGPPQRRAS